MGTTLSRDRRSVSKLHPRKKTDVKEYDLVILGGGTGSTIAAWTFGKQGQRVAVIERKYIGGSCPNIACLPSKNIIHSAKVASFFRRSGEFGIAKREFHSRYVCGSSPETHDGIRLERRLYRQLQKERRGIHPRLWTLHWPQDIGSDAG
jgi:ribulose 1,5-bisphosphate synthetase/thiazole synthase